MVITVALMALTNQMKVADNENKSTSEARNSKEIWTNSVFFVYSALLQQGSYLTPNTISGRTVFVIWWLFAVVYYACYTATLTSSFAVKEPPSPINSIYDLLNTPSYRFGMRKGTFHLRYFKTSTNVRSWNSPIFKTEMVASVIRLPVGFVYIHQFGSPPGSAAFHHSSGGSMGGSLVFGWGNSVRYLEEKTLSTFTEKSMSSLWNLHRMFKPVCKNRKTGRSPKTNFFII
ncbi:uncharacterized protein LOC111083725 [Limulus polyphemus]|uniref:Uncharacterized protein LOC111083725 n=1 Tax=Limulus polyphemus TaxID=6850 RepID=A0ABM1RXJ3_LIMPO|nr:uncharacterized protein LOC111083725 [Limulus polyphemus]